LFIHLNEAFQEGAKSGLVLSHLLTQNSLLLPPNSSFTIKTIAPDQSQKTSQIGLCLLSLLLSLLNQNKCFQIFGQNTDSAFSPRTKAKSAK
jgi:hypothetical protein